MIINLSNFGGGGGGGYVLPIASQNTLGGVKIGSGVNIDSAGTISVPTVDPSTIKSVSALPQTAVAGDVVSYSNQFWEYKATSGTSCVINDFKGYNEYGDIVINYYSLPQNQVLFHFTTNFGFERYVSYNNGVFTLWEDSGMTTSAETITEGSDIDLWWSNVQGTSIPGLLRMTSMQNQNGNINLSASIVGDWNVKSSGHWEPGDWEDQVNSAPLYKVNRVKSSPFATVEGDGINPKMLTRTDSLYDNTFGVMPMSALSNVMITDESGFTLDMSYYPTDINMIRIANIYIGQYQIEYNFYNDGVLFENKDTNDDWHIVSSGIITTNSTDVWDEGEVYESHTSLIDNILSVHLTTDISVQVDNAPMAVLRVGGAYEPFKLRTANVGIATTASTGVVKVGDYLNIDSAGTLSVNASSITNGVSFWKGTQAEYDALSGTTGYDSSTLYIITDTPNAV